MRKVRFVLSVLLLWFLPLGSHAEPPPYLKKIAILQDETGHPYILENLHSELLLSHNRIQIRNQNGVVVAASSTESHVATFCLSLKSCWVFPYKGLTVYPQRLNYKKLNDDSISSQPLSQAFQEYLAGKTDRLKDDIAVGYPYTKDRSLSFHSVKNWFSPFNLIVVFLDNVLLVIILLLLYVIPFFLCKLFFGFTKTWVAMLLGSAVFSVYFIFQTGVTFGSLYFFDCTHLLICFSATFALVVLNWQLAVFEGKRKPFRSKPI